MGLAAFNRMRREQAAKAEAEAKKQADEATPKAKAKHIGGGKWQITLADGKVLDQTFDKKTAIETVKDLNS